MGLGGEICCAIVGSGLIYYRKWIIYFNTIYFIILPKCSLTSAKGVPLYLGAYCPGGGGGIPGRDCCIGIGGGGIFPGGGGIPRDCCICGGAGGGAIFPGGGCIGIGGGAIFPGGGGIG